MTPNWTWTLDSQKYSVYTKYLPVSKGPFWVHFALQLAVSDIQGRQKLEMYRMTPKWTLTINSQKCFIYM